MNKTTGCVLYWYYLRRPDDGNEYDRNMLVINNV